MFVVVCSLYICLLIKLYEYYKSSCFLNFKKLIYFGQTEYFDFLTAKKVEEPLVYRVYNQIKASKATKTSIA